MTKPKSNHNSSKHRSKHRRDKSNSSSSSSISSSSSSSSDESIKDDNNSGTAPINNNDTSDKCTVTKSYRCDKGDKGMKGDYGDRGQKGDAGSKGEKGDAGEKGDTINKTFIIFATSESVSNNDYIGSGNSSSDVKRNSILVPNNCTVNKIAFSIRELSNNNEYSATLFVNGIQSVVNAVIPDGSSQYQIISNANTNLTQLDEITIKIQTNGGALSRGASISLSVTIN